ncbi:nuclear transport factor 2 family protein [Nocardioides KLBMP 9356]|uniref:Nuclear transport factor 2 family protein n=1 Tax=Nocardioides potassii TaxID=2911371 RepID=A0ABS9HD93_9ACTN|nr:nuclear transport factor 2 family protein [Nocardioides potassii]MCF6379147.1 nuclear transport factor 2 family protein [Nocardioides potassii]
MTENERSIRDLYAAIESGATGDELRRFWHPDAEQVEYPSVMRPHGHRRGLDEMIAGSELGLTMIRDQRYDVHTVVEQGDEMAVQLTWTATVARDLGTLAAGTPLVSHVAAFYVFRDGLVLRQSSYDCYEPIAG